MKIKTITAFTDIKTDNIRYKSSYKVFDENGFLVEEYRFDKNGEIISKSENIFDNEHRLLSSTFFDTEQESSENRTYDYSSEGQLIRETVDFGQGYLSVFLYEYSNSGKRITISEQDEEGEVEETKIQELDDYGNVIKEVVINEDGKEITHIFSSFDNKKRPVRKEERDLNYKTTQIQEYIYNDNDFLEMIKTTNAKNQILNWVKLEYDELNRPVKQTSMSGSVILVEYIDDKTRIEKHINSHGYTYSESKITVNEWGNLLKEDSPEIVTEFEYEYFES
ncbi:MAG: hypothetical protein KBB11_01675 [Bacteroidales bacterium]|nr:hypothetical protein [Bacteroidales bacterium]HOY38216.1 hypothetical protein [Bacteroidales bacterium]HQP03019.1 hypothetical protein [Bacteroidales bacterium]